MESTRRVKLGWQCGSSYAGYFREAQEKNVHKYKEGCIWLNMAGGSQLLDLAFGRALAMFGLDVNIALVFDHTGMTVFDRDAYVAQQGSLSALDRAGWRFSDVEVVEGRYRVQLARLASYVQSLQALGVKVTLRPFPEYNRGGFSGSLLRGPSTFIDALRTIHDEIPFCGLMVHGWGDPLWLPPEGGVVTHLGISLYNVSPGALGAARRTNAIAAARDIPLVLAETAAVGTDDMAYFRGLFGVIEENSQVQGVNYGDVLWGHPFEHWGDSRLSRLEQPVLDYFNEKGATLFR